MRTRGSRRARARSAASRRTLLTIFRRYAGLLRRFSQATPEDRSAAVAQTDRDAERLSRLVENLLTLARVDAGQPLTHASVSIGPLLEDVASRRAS